MGNIDLLEDACAALPHRSRGMFGGHGLFAPNGGMFAAIVDLDRIALKLPRAEDFEAFLAEGAEPWVYDGRVTMSSWAVVPDALYDEPRRLADWARRAHATAVPPKPRAKKGAAKKAGTKKATTKKAAAKKAAARQGDSQKAAKKAPSKKRAAKR